MELGGVLAYPQLVRDRLVRVTPCDQLEYLPLTWRKRHALIEGRPVGSPATGTMHGHLERRVDHGQPSRNRSHRRAEAPCVDVRRHRADHSLRRPESLGRWWLADEEQIDAGPLLVDVLLEEALSARI